MNRVGWHFGASCSIVGFQASWVDKASVYMSGEGPMADSSGDSVRSLLKKHATKTSNQCDSVHTFPEDAADSQSKGSYETARDRRVAELKAMFKPVEEAAKTLSVLLLSPISFLLHSLTTMFCKMREGSHKRATIPCFGVNGYSAGGITLHVAALLSELFPSQGLASF